MAKLCRAYRPPPPKLCATRMYKAHCAQLSTAQTKKEEKKGKNGGHDNSAQIDDREKANEKKTRIVADAVCYGCTSPNISHINLFLQSNHCSLSTKASHFSLVLRYFFSSFILFCIWDTHLCLCVCVCVPIHRFVISKQESHFDIQYVYLSIVCFNAKRSY